ncbi:hypothetical protein ABK046_46435, partial [Streptomyces caeruleatus]
IEVLIGQRGIELKSEMGLEKVAEVTVGQWQNLQLTIDLDSSSVSGRIGSATQQSDFSPRRMSPISFESLNLLCLDSVGAETKDHSPLEVDN